MYGTQPFSGSKTNAAAVRSSGAALESAMPLNVGLFVNSMVQQSTANMHASRMQNLKAELDRQRVIASAGDKALQVNHNETFKVYSEIDFRGSLREFAASESLRTWSASQAPLKLPAGARVVLLSSTFTEKQNTLPVATMVQLANTERNALSTAASVQGDIAVKAHTRAPLQIATQLFQRKNPENIDMNTLLQWKDTTEKSIDAELLEMVKDQHGNMIAKVAYPSLTTQVIQNICPDLDSTQIAYVQADPINDPTKIITFVAKDIYDTANELAKSVIKTTNFCDPDALTATLVRADGLPFDSPDNIADAAPGLSAFGREGNLNCKGVVSVTLEREFALIMPPS